MFPDTLAPCRGRRPHNIDNSEGQRRGRAVLLMDFWNICLQLAEGMLTSLAIFALTLIFSLPLGLLVAFARKSKHAWLRVPVKVYISVMRGTPLMLQLLIVYFGPYLIFGAKLSADYRFPATISAFSVNYAAYFAEIFRSGALFDANSIPHTKWLSATRWEIESDPEGVCDGVIAKLGWPVFVKPANAGSSVGITKATNREQLKEAIQLALANDRKVVFEAFVDGHEVECAVIGSDPAVATRPGEILAGAEFYTYDDKYKNGVSQVVIPANLPEEKLDEVKTYAAMAYTALGCEGLARCDFFVEHGTGRVLINEINTLPGFTPISMYPKLMEHEGTPIPALIDHLIALALERTEKQHG